MTGGKISGDRVPDDASEKARKKREPKPPRRFYKTVEQVKSQPIMPATELPVLGITACNTTRKRLEEKGLFPQRRVMPGCQRMVFYRREDIVAYLEIVNDPQWSGTDADYKARMASRTNGGGNAT
jgi:hypothetical protein